MSPKEQVHRKYGPIHAPTFNKNIFLLLNLSAYPAFALFKHMQ